MSFILHRVVCISCWSEYTFVEGVRWQEWVAGPQKCQQCGAEMKGLPEMPLLVTKQEPERSPE